MDDLPLDSLSELYVQISSTGQLTRADRCGLRDALLRERIEEEAYQAIDRLIYAVRVGRIKLVN
jgi:hypothetical protein